MSSAPFLKGQMMMKPSPIMPRGAAVLLLAAAAFCPRPGYAADDGLKLKLDGLMRIGWTGAYKELAAAEKEYALIDAAAPGEVRVHYAMALVAVKHHRYSRALELIDKMLRLKPNLWLSQKARIWLLVVLRNYEAGLEQMRATAAEFAPAGRKADGTDLERVRFLGRMYGFIEGPAVRELAPEVLRRYEKSITEPLKDEALAAFDEGRHSLLTSYARRHADQEATREDSKEAELRDRERKAISLAEEKQQVIDDAAGLRAQADELREALKKELAELDNMLDKLRGDLDSVSQRASLVAARLSSLQLDINRVRAELDLLPPENVFERDRWFLLLRSLDARYARELAVYQPLVAQGRQLEGQIAGLSGRRNQTLAQFNAQIGGIDKTLANLQKRFRRVEQDQRKLERGEATGNTGSVRAKQALTGALTTYEPFPVEQERRKILDSFK